jgi:hypothetical protein
MFWFMPKLDNLTNAHGHIGITDLVLPMRMISRQCPDGDLKQLNIQALYGDSSAPAQRDEPGWPPPHVLARCGSV